MKRIFDEYSQVPGEKAMAPHSSTPAWEIPWTEEPGRLQSKGSLRVGHNWTTSLTFSLSCIGEGDGNPHQCSCLENPRDGGAWWAAIYGVAHSRTQLKRFSQRQQHEFQSLLYHWPSLGKVIYFLLEFGFPLCEMCDGVREGWAS